MASHVVSTSSNTATSNNEETLDTGQAFFEAFSKIKNKARFEGKTHNIDVSLCENAIRNLTTFDGGGYGDVFYVRSTNQTELSLLIKRIQCKDDGDGRFIHEKLAARIMHFGIVPLWAWAEDISTRTFYFVLPCLANKSLLQALQLNTTDGIELMLGRARRLRILYDVACALAFLHKKIPNFRCGFVHGDVTTKNIVLDTKLNARLFDVGLAREYTSGKAGATAGETYKPEELTVEMDVFSYGIVIREVLYRHPSCDKGHEEQALSEKLTNDDFLKTKKEDIKIVWGKPTNENKVVTRVHGIAIKCLEQNITWDTIKTNIESLVRQEDGKWMDHEPRAQRHRCVMCWINVVDSEAQKILNHQKCKLHVCAACMRNSILNPIECHSCEKNNVEPLVIGHQWAAILVAGNDVNDEKAANVFVNDLDKVSRAITSRLPKAMGMSIGKVFYVYPGEPGSPTSLLNKLKTIFAAAAVAKRDIHSLLFYFTGHHDTKEGFQLGDETELLKREQLEEYLDNLKLKRLLVMLDCCYAPILNLNVKCLYQINSCNADQVTKFPVGKGSLMTAFFVQSLRGRSSSSPCQTYQKKTNGEGKEEEIDCENCVKFRIDSKNGFINMNQLCKNVEIHIDTYWGIRGVEGPYIPTQTIGKSYADSVIAYYIDSPCNFKCSLHQSLMVSKTRKVEVEELPDDMQNFKEILFEKCREQLKLPTLDPKNFSDMLVITFRTGLSGCNNHELDTIEMVEAALNGNRELCVSLREIPNLHRGKVGVFMESDGDVNTVLECLKAYHRRLRWQEESHEVKISLVENGARKLLDYVETIRGFDGFVKCNEARETIVGDDEACLRKRDDHTVLNCLTTQLTSIKDNANIKNEGTLVFTFPLKDTEGHGINNFCSIQIAEAEAEKPLLQELRKYLLSAYEGMPQHITICPGKTLDLEKLYVKQEFKLIDLDRKPKGKGKRGEQARVASVADILTHNGQICKNILISAEPGLGKSTFCKHLVRQWCIAYAPDNAKLTDDQKTLKRFELLFYIDLRYATIPPRAPMYDEISELIHEQLDLTDTCSIAEIRKLLSETSALVVMDSLDELGSSRRPKRGIHNNSCIVTTSRSWKIEALRTTLIDVNQHIEIVGLAQTSPKSLANNVLKLLNSGADDSEEKTGKAFITEMVTKKLQHLLNIPLLLIRMLVLWFGGDSFGDTQFQIYSDVIHHQILTAINSKELELPKYDSISYKRIFPCCNRCSGPCPCRVYRELLWKIAKMAYHTLFSKEEKMCLVFDRYVTEMYDLSPEEVITCLKIGLLTQHTLLVKNPTKQKKQVNFPHKTNQEYFAAIFLSEEGQQSDLDHIRSVVSDLDRALELDTVLFFCSENNTAVASQLSHLISEIADNNPSVQEYRHSCELSRYDAPHADLIEKIQNIIIPATQQNTQLFLSDIIIKDDEGPQWRRIEGQDRKHFIHYLDLTIIKSLGISAYATDELLQSLKLCNHLQKLVLCDSGIKVKDIHEMVVRNKATLVTLCLAGEKYVGRKPLDILTLGAQWRDMLTVNLSSLGLINVKLSHAQCQDLCTFVATTNNLRQVKLKYISCETHGDYESGTFFFLDFQSHINLQTVVLKHLPEFGDVNNVCLSATMEKLEHVELYYCIITSAGLRCLINSLPNHNVKVVLLRLTVTDDENIFQEIRDSPNTNITLDWDVKKEGDGWWAWKFIFDNNNTLPGPA